MPEDVQARRRASFNRIASLYDRARPGYPEALFDDLVVLSGIPPSGRILEIGCGTGHATLPLARRGYRILAVELGANLVAFTRRKLAAWPAVEVRLGDFEKLPMEEGVFDLAVAASAFHWIDPAIGYPKVASALRPGGAFALWGNKRLEGEGSEGFLEAVQEVYRREAPEARRGDRPAKDRAAALKQSGLFLNLRTREYRWTASYDAPGYLRLLSTSSRHAILERARRERLFRGIADLINTRYHGRIALDFLTTLHVAERA